MKFNHYQNCGVLPSPGNFSNLNIDFYIYEILVTDMSINQEHIRTRNSYCTASEISLSVNKLTNRLLKMQYYDDPRDDFWHQFNDSWGI